MEQKKINKVNSISFNARMYKFTNLVIRMIEIIDSITDGKKYKNHLDWFQKIIEKMINELFNDLNIIETKMMPLMNKFQHLVISSYIFSLETKMFKDENIIPGHTWNTFGFDKTDDVPYEYIMVLDDCFVIKPGVLDIIKKRLQVINDIYMFNCNDRYYKLTESTDKILFNLVYHSECGDEEWNDLILSQLQEIVFNL